MSENECHLVVVLGMHRSGTSLVARSLEALGVDLGGNLEPPVKGVNDKGFFEDIEINRFSDELLSALNSNWDSLRRIPPFAYSRELLASFTLKAVDLLRPHKHKAIYGLKNPRFSKLLPFWKNIFEHLHLEPSYLIVVRHPISVAQSLKNRDGFNYLKSYYLWLDHTVSSIKETSGSKRVVVDYDLLMANPELQLRRISESLGLDFNQNSPSLKDFINEFMDGELRHAHFEVEDLSLDPRIPEEVIRAYELMLGLASDEVNINDPIVDAKFSSLNAKLESLQPLFTQFAQFDKKISEHADKIEYLNKFLTERDQQIVNLYSKINECDHKIAELYGDRDAQVATLFKTVNERDNKILSLNTTISELQQIDSLAKSVVFYEERIENLNKSIIDKDDFIADQKKLIDNLRRDIEIYTTSTSWRITGPLRQLGDFLKK